jgi:hypothetical protein
MMPQDKSMHQGTDKVARYGWTVTDEPGVLRMLHKDHLLVPAEYQRDANEDKVRKIASEWSWLSFGAVIVGHRGGKYYTIDGQHRVLAAKRRSDVGEVPCVVFKTNDISTEARGFLSVNSGRKPVTAIQKQKALVVAGDETAALVQDTINRCGLEVRSTTNGVDQIKCVALCIRLATEDKNAFRQVLSFVAELSKKDGVAVKERLLEGVWFLHRHCGNGLDDKRLNRRLRDIGAEQLLEAANRAGAFYARGGAKVWADGMLNACNKGLHNKFAIGADEP